MAAAAASESCVLCDEPAKKTCGRCGKVKYCSKECQAAHWRGGHAVACLPLNVTTMKRKHFFAMVKRRPKDWFVVLADGTLRVLCPVDSPLGDGTKCVLPHQYPTLYANGGLKWLPFTWKKGFSAYYTADRLDPQGDENMVNPKASEWGKQPFCGPVAFVYGEGPEWYDSMATKSLYETVVKDDDGNSIVCAICLEPATEHVFTLPCGYPQIHSFHRTCLLKWVITKQKEGQTPQCPLCRENYVMDAATVGILKGEKPFG